MKVPYPLGGRVGVGVDLGHETPSPSRERAGLRVKAHARGIAVKARDME